jgi:hypothetical protein
MMPRNGSSFGPHRRSAPQISCWHRKRRHFRHRPRIDSKTPGRFPLTDCFYVNCSSYLRECFPPASSLRPPLPLSGELAIADGFYSGATDLSGYSTEGFSLRCLPLLDGSGLEESIVQTCS